MKTYSPFLYCVNGEPLTSRVVARMELRFDESGEYVLKSDYDALILLLAAGEKVWQPMESAPKDGTVILVYGTLLDDELPQVVTVRWGEHGSVSYWGLSHDAHYDGPLCIDNPLGWQPLPKLPTTP